MEREEQKTEELEVLDEGQEETAEVNACCSGSVART
jgi:putative radical SAM-modified peptide